MKYTIEQFEIDFENATLEQKSKLLDRALDSVDSSNGSAWKEIFIKYKEDLKDIINQNNIEENYRCLKDIETGVAELYTCIDSIFDFKQNHNYYVRIDDYASEMKGKWLSGLAEKSEKFKEMIDAIEKLKPIICVYLDDGIGTLKRKIIFPDSDIFPNHFKKFENNLI